MDESFCTRKVGLQVIAEKTKIYSYFHVTKILIYRMIPEGQTD